MKSKVIKRIGTIMLGLSVIILSGACSEQEEKGILGTWKYDIAENADPDMKGITLTFTEDELYLINDFDGEKATLDCTYEKDDTVIYITSMSHNGKKIESDEEFIQLPYTFLENEKLMLDMNDAGMGKVVLSKVEE